MVRYGGNSANPRRGGKPPDCTCLEAHIDILPADAPCSIRCVLKHIALRLLIACGLCTWFAGFFIFIMCANGNKIVKWLPADRRHCDVRGDQPILLVGVLAIWGALAPLCLPCVIRPRKCMSEEDAKKAG